VHRPLGKPRSPGGVHDEEGVSLETREIRLVIRRGSQQIAEAKGEGIHGLTQVHPAADGGGALAPGMEICGGLPERVAVDQGLRTAVLEDERQLVRGEPAVERHAHGAEFGQSEKQLHVPGAIAQE
jgi:hypothetical protein